MPVPLELVFVLVLVALNGALAMSEIAVVTARRSRLRRRADEGDAGAAAALDLAEHPSRFLSTVQIGITLVGILAGAFGGATLAEELADLLATTGVSASWTEPLAIAAVVVPITYLNVVLGELVPKRVALADPEGVATRISRPMRALAAAGRPVVWLLSRSTSLVVRLLGLREGREDEVTEEDLVAALRQAASGGVIERQEERIVERLFRLSDLSVAELMTPRDRVVCVPLDGELDLARIEAHPHPRYVVTRGDGIDDAVGFVSVHDLLLRAARGQRPLLGPDEVRDPHWVPPGFPALRLLHLFQASGVHLAVVRDSRSLVRWGSDDRRSRLDSSPDAQAIGRAISDEGAPSSSDDHRSEGPGERRSQRVVGIVTLTDLLEHVVGELPDVKEFEDRPIVMRGDGSWLVDGAVALRDLRRALPNAVRARLDGLEGTVAQLVAARAEPPLGPTTAIDLDGLRLEVVDMDWDRIDKVLVTAGSP